MKIITEQAASPEQLKLTFNPTEHVLRVPRAAGGYVFGVVSCAVAFPTVYNAPMLDTAVIVSQLSGAAVLGVSAACLVSGYMVVAGWQHTRRLTMIRTVEDDEDEDEAEAWQEPPQPDNMPSFVRHADEPKNLKRVNHNMKRSDLLLLSQLAKVGRKLPTRESLVARGFTNNAQAFTNLRRELQKTGVVDSQYCWTREGWEWIYSEANRPTRN
jgi:hypothetical protein